MLSYRKETVLQGALIVLAKNGRLKLGDNILTAHFAEISTKLT